MPVASCASVVLVTTVVLVSAELPQPSSVSSASTAVWSQLGAWIQSHPDGGGRLHAIPDLPPDPVQAPPLQLSPQPDAPRGEASATKSPADSSATREPVGRSKRGKRRLRRVLAARAARNGSRRGSGGGSSRRGATPELRHIKMHHYGSVATHGADVTGAELLSLLEEQRPWLLRYNYHGPIVAAGRAMSGADGTPLLTGKQAAQQAAHDRRGGKSWGGGVGGSGRGSVRGSLAQLRASAESRDSDGSAASGNKWKFWKTLLSNAYCAEETMSDGGRRVVLASVPRSGSTWLRTLLEWSTNISTEVCCWGEGGNYSERSRGFSSCQPIEWANGYRAPPGPTCGRLHRSGVEAEPAALTTAPAAAAAAAAAAASATARRKQQRNQPEPVVVKTHYPFHKPGKHLTPAATIVLIVRNPLSNYDGWRRYLAETRRADAAATLSLASFGRLWGAHVRFWVMRATTSCTKLYEVRYEDIVDAAAAQLYGVLQGTGLFAQLGLHAWHVHEAIATAARTRLRPMRDAPAEVLGSGVIQDGLPRHALVWRERKPVAEDDAETPGGGKAKARHSKNTKAKAKAKQRPAAGNVKKRGRKQTATRDAASPEQLASSTLATASANEGVPHAADLDAKPTKPPTKPSTRLLKPAAGIGGASDRGEGGGSPSRALCRRRNERDSRQSMCSSWCEPIKRAAHCIWCKCRACSWCA